MLKLYKEAELDIVELVKDDIIITSGPIEGQPEDDKSNGNDKDIIMP